MRLRDWLWAPVLMVGFPVLLSAAFGFSIRSEMSAVKEFKDDQHHLAQSMEALDKELHVITDHLLSLSQSLTRLLEYEQTVHPDLATIFQVQDRLNEHTRQLQDIHATLSALQDRLASPKSSSTP